MEQTNYYHKLQDYYICALHFLCFYQVASIIIMIKHYTVCNNNFKMYDWPRYHH